MTAPKTTQPKQYMDAAEPPVMLAHIGTDVLRHNITKWPNGADWRWIWRKGLGVDVRLKNHAKPKAETPLLAILALRKQGYGVKQIAKRLGSNVATVCASVELYGVKPPVAVVPRTNQKWRDLWSSEYVRTEIEQHGRIEWAHDKWWRQAYKRKAIDYYYDNHEKLKSYRALKARESYYRLKDNPAFRFKKFARRQLMRIARQARYGYAKNCRTHELLGCNYQEAADYIESLLRPGWTWDNYGKVWEIDHIVQLSDGDLSDSGHIEAVCYYKNLRPMSVSENRSRKRGAWSNRKRNAA